MQFHYKVIDKNQLKSGEINAESEIKAKEKLYQEGYKILELYEKKGGEIRKNIFSDDLFGGGASMKVGEKILFTDQLASMLKAGLPMIEALEAFVDEKKAKGSSKLVKGVLVDVQSGTRFSEGLAQYPKVFNPAYLAVVKAGEASGTLAESLQYLAEQLKRESELVSRVRSALIYPAIVLTAMVGVMSFIMISVVPKIVSFADNAGYELPIYTRIMLEVTKFMTNNWLLMLVVIILFGVGFVVFQMSTFGKKLMSKIWLQIPVIGELVAKYNQVRFTRMLGGFYKYGVSVVGSFDILAESLPNTEYKEACLRIKGRLELGQTLAQALSEEDVLFPSIMGRLVRGGERSGELGFTLEKLSTFYEGELENAMKNLTLLIEPVMVILLGVGVLGLALSVVVPIYKVTSGLK